jgi:hypothetical protein
MPPVVMPSMTPVPAMAALPLACMPVAFEPAEPGRRADFGHGR